MSRTHLLDREVRADFAVAQRWRAFCIDGCGSV